VVNSVDLFVPKGALYKDMFFEFDVKIDSNYIGNTVYSIHKNTTPLHKRIKLKIKKPKLKKVLENKLVIVKKNGRSISSKTTKIEGDYLSAKLKEFGDYSISIDTVPPKVSLEKIDTSSNDKFIVFNISDNLSGIDSYNGSVDQKWILFKYDYKNAQIYYKLDKYLVKNGSKRTLLLKVKDGVGNITKVEEEFIY
jgi:hypothetical protein